jgi:DNA primase
VRIVPFKLPDLIEAISTDKTVFIVEGEKDVLNLRAQGVPATCNPMGAGKWREDFNTIFRGADVVICGDNDEPGRDHVRKIAQSLHGIAGRLRVLDLAKFWPEIEPSSDVSDFLQHHTVERLWHIVEDLPDWKRSATNGGSGATPDDNSASKTATPLFRPNAIGP